MSDLQVSRQLTRDSTFKMAAKNDARAARAEAGAGIVLVIIVGALAAGALITFGLPCAIAGALC